MEMSKLPDKGARLRRSLEKSANEEKEINERISFVDSQLKSASGEFFLINY